MASYYIDGWDVAIDRRGTRFIFFRFRNAKKRDYVRHMMEEALLVGCGAGLTVASCKWNFHPLVTSNFFAMAVDGALTFASHYRRWFRRLRPYNQERISSSFFLSIGVALYSRSLVVFSRNLKRNHFFWIPNLAAATAGYLLSVKSHNSLGRTICRKSAVCKVYQLFFGPMLIGSAAYYLLCIQQHGERWLHCFPLLASAAAGNHMSFTGYERDDDRDDARYLKFKGLEIMMGGFVMCINGFALLVYGAYNDLNPLVNMFFILLMFTGITDMSNSLATFQRCIRMEYNVFYPVCGLIAGPIIFFSSYFCVGCIDLPIMLPVYIVVAGLGIHIFADAFVDLLEGLPYRVFIRYCQRIMGPTALVYGSLVSAYAALSMGKRYSLLFMPIVTLGAYYTYKGWK